MEHNTTIYLPVCDKVVTAEVGCDFSMPDYQPEIRRLLRVRATVLPPSSYVGAGKAEFSGTVRYDILYSGNDGGLYSATTAENYEVSAALDKDAEVDFSDELPVFCEVCTESVTGRVTAPRKMSLRCRLRGSIKAFGRHRLCERLLGEVPSGGVERLSGEGTCAVLTPGFSETFTLSEEVPVERKTGEIRVIASDAMMTVTEAVAVEEGIGCRGDATLKLLICHEESDVLPYTVTRRVPFAVTVPADRFDGLSFRAVAHCVDLSTEVTEEGNVLCDLSATVVAEGQGNIPVMYTSDLYASLCESRAVYTEYRFPKACRCVFGNFTQSVYETLESYGLESDCEVLDMNVTSAVQTVSYDRGKWIFGGESRANLLVKTGDEYATHEIVLPFRYESDGEEGEPMLTASDVQMMTGRARVDGGRLGLECEMAIAARVCTAESLTALTEAQFGEAVEAPTDMIVAFPAKGETLWSLAKRYHTPVTTLVKLNGIPAIPTAALPFGEPIVIHE